MSISKKLMMTAAGGEALNVEDVFSTYLYTGTGSAQTITNGIDLANEGGMVWIKNRDAGDWHEVFDTERGVGHRIHTNRTDADLYTAISLDEFNSDGFAVRTLATVNTNGEQYASWTFRKARKFFDVVTYTGDDTAGRTVSHNLGSVPGCIIIKSTSVAGDWMVYHRGVDSTAPEDYALFLNFTDGRDNNVVYFNDTAPTDTVFTVGNNTRVNGSGATYVAYLFAHNDDDGEFGPTGDQDIIKCGSYTGTGSSGNFVDIGWEPQWVLTKRTNTSSEWNIWDNMRGISAGGKDNYLRPNAVTAEGDTGNGNRIDFNPTGFTLQDSDADTNSSSDNYIYIAIRRGPMAVPESVTDVFDAISYTADNTDRRLITSSNRVDTVIARNRNNSSAQGFYVADRFRATSYLGTDTTLSEANDTDSFSGLDYTNGFEVGNDPTRRLNYSNYTQIAYTWTRAPNFFDIVAYNGKSSVNTITHSLGVLPEMIWVKRRNAGGNWIVYHAGLNGGTNPEQYYIELNDTDDESNASSYWNDTAPTDTQFTLGTLSDVNQSGGTYIAYLFASLDGISKVGSYTGNGTSQTIDCGFSSGARFVLIKRTDSAGQWYVFDSERGIVAGNDKTLTFTDVAAETAGDYIDPDNSGFIVNQDLATNINNGSGSYIFYAIA